MSWRSAQPSDYAILREFLSAPGRNATVPADRLRRFGCDRAARKAHRYYLWMPNGRIEALLYHGARGFFFPVGITSDSDAVYSLRRALGGFVRLHSVMGVTGEVETFSGLFRANPVTSMDYYGMALSRHVYPPRYTPPLRGLVRRTATEARIDDLIPLHVAYEREEVLLPGKTLRIDTSLQVLRESLQSQIVYIAEDNGSIIARAATNARGFTDAQIGGVYTNPAYRGRGVARWLITELLARLQTEELDAALFVKTGNRAAITLYRSLGFEIVTNFRINYYW